MRLKKNKAISPDWQTAPVDSHTVASAGQHCFVLEFAEPDVNTEEERKQNKTKPIGAVSHGTSRDQCVFNKTPWCGEITGL